ncbi:hypothetical protein ACFQGA_01920 [Marinobacter koreensis]|uniref:Uncharacterized protein n=1 Tax=Marinobacter koreensis TaxID=335974 RepID=A0ABW0RSA0_9GAMM|nr:hypothetical protein [Marinobacter koreensis]MCK7548650.1 hypothetical protein [Marinobacter koreensis]
MAELKRPMDGLERVLGRGRTAAILPDQKNQNVRNFRKFLPFHRPVTEDLAFLVRSYTKIVTKNYEKMVS